MFPLRTLAEGIAAERSKPAGTTSAAPEDAGKGDQVADEPAKNSPTPTRR
jgi:hypothetical protein